MIFSATSLFNINAKASDYRECWLVRRRCVSQTSLLLYVTMWDYTAQCEYISVAVEHFQLHAVAKLYNYTVQIMKNKCVLRTLSQFYD